MSGLDIPSFFHELWAHSQLAESYIMFIWPMHIPFEKNSLITIVNRFSLAKLDGFFPQVKKVFGCF